MTVVIPDEVQTDAESTPNNEYLKRLAAENPPPDDWFEGDEEDLF